MGGVEVPQVPRGMRCGGGGIPLSTGGNGLGSPSPENFSYFLLKIPYFDAFWGVYFLNHTLMGGVLTPHNPLLGTPLYLTEAFKRKGDPSIAHTSQ